MSDQNAFMVRLNEIVGAAHVFTTPARTARFTQGYRFGSGRVLAVVQPGSLVELWRVAQASVAAGHILIMQAANTGLTGGSTPDGNHYDRSIVLISTVRIDRSHLIGDGKQVICLPGVRLYELEAKLAALGREPHSVIGSSCIGASVLGGISNNSGGALVQRGPAFTEMALFGQVDAQGELHLVNHLGVRLGDQPEQILRRVEAGDFTDADIDWNAGRGHDDHYVTHVRDVDADTPARFNADAGRLYEASGCAGKLVLFAVRLDTFPANKETSVFYIGSNGTDVLEDLRRHLLTGFAELPISGEYLHRDAFDIAEHYGKDTFAAIRYLGTKFLPRLFALKSQVDVWGRGLFFLPTHVRAHLSDHVLQAFSRLLPRQLPARMLEYRQHYEHHLMLKVSATLAGPMRAWLKEFFDPAESDASKGGFFECTAQEGTLAFLHRFAAAGAAIRYRAVHAREAEDIVALDVALRRNDRDWFEKLPAEIEEKLIVKLYYGHFLCHVMHQDYVVKKGFDAMAVEHSMLPVLDQRGARYPAEHNFGHLYQAPSEVLAHYRALDPCNCLNPGIGKATKKRDWKAELVNG